MRRPVSDGAVGSQVIDVLEAQEMRRPAMKRVAPRGEADQDFFRPEANLHSAKSAISLSMKNAVPTVVD
jgi:hypothetical protein